MELSNEANIEHHHHRENTLWKHVHPLWIIFQIGSGYARPANQLHDPNVLGNAPIAPTRENLWCFLTLFDVHIGHAHWTSFNFKAPNAVVNVRLYCAILVGFGLLHVELFLQTDPWEPSFCKSTHEKHPPAWKKNLMPFWPLSSSNQIWLHKDMRGNYGLHSPCQQLGSWFHVPISNFSPSKNGCLIIYIISHLLSNCPALAYANNVFAPDSARLRIEMGNSQCCAWALPRLWRSNAACLPCRSFGMASTSWKKNQPTRRNMKN